LTATSPPRSIRRRIPADTTFIRTLGKAAFGEYASGAGDGAMRMASRAATLVAIEAARRLGFAIIEPEGTVAHLSAIAVIEEARGEGVGRALLRAAEQLARSEGADRLVLVTADSNVAALQLFLRNGFQRSPRQPKAYPRGQKAVVLEKKL
jgi:ribosomal protein S18 acetylase RimI-like enzyme